MSVHLWVKVYHTCITLSSQLGGEGHISIEYDISGVYGPPPQEGAVDWCTHPVSNHTTKRAL